MTVEFWFLIGAALVFWMQADFAMVETGFTRAKNADPLDYRWATAMEALAGYLYLEGDTARLEWFMGRAVEIIEQGM